MRNNQGLVSFLVVMFISVLLVMITAAFVQIMSRELRQATDNELSTRAYYSAEAGIEEGLVEIREAIENDNLDNIEQTSCESKEWGFNDHDATGFSCRLISFQPNALEGRLDADTSRQFHFMDVGHDTLRVQWHHQDRGDYTEDTDFAEIPSNPFNPPAAGWTGDLPPIMRVEIVSYPDESFQEEDVTQRVTFLRPSESSLGTSSVDLADIEPGQNMRTANCDPNAQEYACSFHITGMNEVDEEHHMMRIKPFYNDTHYGIEALSGGQFGGSPVAIPGNVAIIDVTGYANDVFRRLQARVPLESVDAFGQDHVLLGDGGVCKVMRITRIDNRSSTNTGCERP